MLISESLSALVELKRIKRSSFQPEQLAREFYLVTKDAKRKIPLLVLIINKKPPVSVQRHGRVDPVEFIKNTLPQVYAKSDSHHLSLDTILEMVDDHVAWITWDEIYKIIKENKECFSSEQESIQNSIIRLCDVLLDAIERHS